MPSSIDLGRCDSNTMMVMITAATTTTPTIHAKVDHCTEVCADCGRGDQKLRTHLGSASDPAHMVWAHMVWAHMVWAHMVWAHMAWAHTAWGHLT